MKRFYTLLFSLITLTTACIAQGWPKTYGGVMLQGFFWDSFSDTQWTNLEAQADELSQYFSLIWVPQSGKCLETYNTMGYTPYYYFNQNSSFGTESQLRSMISTFKAKGIKTIADVVVNHHNTNGWFEFPAEVYKGVTYQFQPSDIVANDDGGATKTEADKQGISLSSNYDEGEGWGGMRDLDHKSANVQNIIKAYVRYLKDDLGYQGFRYDMTKGFAASHVADYNDAAGIEFSVGEYWDGNATAVKNWIDAASKKSASFDFAFRYAVRNAINGSTNGTQTSSQNWTLLGDDKQTTGINISSGEYRQWAVTFVENHDTQYRSASEQNDPIRKDTLAANAFLLAMPGTPCVFLPHWKAYKQEIKAMIDARKAVGITNTSTYSRYLAEASRYGAIVNGEKGDLLVVVGNGANTYQPAGARWIKILSGHHYQYYMDRSVNLAWADKASGTYDGDFDVTLTAVTADAGAQVVYTLDGSEPSATNGTKVASGTKVRIRASETLKAGLLVNGKVESILTRNYTVQAFSPYEITVYVNADAPGWNTGYVNFHTWGNYRKGTTWPGDKVTATTTVNGKNWYYKTYNITRADDYVNFVFSIGTSTTASQNQTVDILNVNKTTFYEISVNKDGGKYTVNDVTATTGIDGITMRPDRSAAIYTIDGRRVNTTAPESLGKGIYVSNGKKFVVK
ncbi:MAG: alpha-amylase family glycosyl hydrolase [Prevotella sp.]|nr:alpha-amylase family glycosyl hydrolase [Prevotella sp.]